MSYHIGNMRRHRRPNVTQRQPNWLLVCAMVALSVHALANMGLMPTRGQPGNGAASQFFAEICTGQGMAKAGPSAPRGAPGESAPDDSDWCELCSLAAGPVLASAAPAQPLTEASAHRLIAGPWPVPAPAEWVLQSPRGPPLLG